MTEPNVIEVADMAADGEESIEMVTIGPQPKPQATTTVTGVIEINLKKQRSCMVKVPRHLSS
jgi:hypothetical protein